MVVKERDKKRSEPAGGLGQPLAGAPDLPPLHVLTGVVERPLPNGGSCYWGTIDSELLAKVTFAPLTEFRQTALVRIRSKAGYQPPPSVLETKRFADCVCSYPTAAFPPVVLSGRGRWCWRPTVAAEAREVGELMIFDSAAIIDGHEQIGGFALAASEHGVRVPADFIVMPTLPLQEERLQYEIFQGNGGNETSASIHRRPAQNPPDMLRVTTDWSEVEILTEPYVVWTRRGYTAMIDARVVGDNEVRGLYVGAKSLCEALEDLRPAEGTLVGLKVRLCKESADQYAGYEVERL